MKTKLINKKSNAVVSCLVVLMFFVFSGCGIAPVNSDGLDEGTGGDDGSSVAIESQGTDIQYLYVPPYDNDPETPSEVHTMQSWYGDRVLVIDPERHFPIDWETDDGIPGDYDPEDITEVKDEDNNPDSYTCALSSTPPESGTFTTDGAGTNELPERDENWDGSEGGGCGTWATAMCNRILGDTDSDNEVTKEEWNDIADGIDQNEGGGSKMSDQSKYYEDKGYCVVDKKFGGSQADYQEMVEKINDNCDVKLFFWKRKADGTYTNGHTETVTGADSGNESCTTNSWGEEATIGGGDDGDFDHSRDGDAFQDSEGNELWPEDATEVWVSYVCKCSFWGSIGKALGF